MMEGTLIDHFSANSNWRNVSSVFTKPEKWELVPHLPGAHLCIDGWPQCGFVIEEVRAKGRKFASGNTA